jgi:hypothetical protein
VRGSSRSRLARQLGHPKIWGKRLDAKTYSEVVEALLSAAASYEMVRRVSTSFDVDGWRLAANAIRLFESEGRSDGRPANTYFISLYRSLADALASGAGFCLAWKEASTQRKSIKSGGSGGNGGSAGVPRIDKV